MHGISLPLGVIHIILSAYKSARTIKAWFSGEKSRDFGGPQAGAANWARWAVIGWGEAWRSAWPSTGALESPQRDKSEARALSWLYSHEYYLISWIVIPWPMKTLRASNINFHPHLKLTCTKLSTKVKITNFWNYRWGLWRSAWNLGSLISANQRSVLFSAHLQKSESAPRLGLKARAPLCHVPDSTHALRAITKRKPPPKSRDFSPENRALIVRLWSDESQARNFFASRASVRPHASVQWLIGSPACDWLDWISHFRPRKTPQNAPKLWPAAPTYLFPEFRFLHINTLLARAIFHSQFTSYMN